LSLRRVHVLGVDRTARSAHSTVTPRAVLRFSLRQLGRNLAIARRCSLWSNLAARHTALLLRGRRGGVQPSCRATDYLRPLDFLSHHPRIELAAMSPQDLHSVIANELGLAPRQVGGALALFDEGNTLPFIARYRKEATGGLDELQLRDVRDRAQYLRELAERRAAILESIESQGKLDAALKARIEAAETNQSPEHVYLQL